MKTSYLHKLACVASLTLASGLSACDPKSACEENPSACSSYDVLDVSPARIGKGADRDLAVKIQGLAVPSGASVQRKVILKDSKNQTVELETVDITDKACPERQGAPVQCQVTFKAKKAQLQQLANGELTVTVVNPSDKTGMPKVAPVRPRLYMAPNLPRAWDMREPFGADDKLIGAHIRELNTSCNAGIATKSAAESDPTSVYATFIHDKKPNDRLLVRRYMYIAGSKPGKLRPSEEMDFLSDSAIVMTQCELLAYSPSQAGSVLKSTDMNLKKPAVSVQSGSTIPANARGLTASAGSSNVVFYAYNDGDPDWVLVRTYREGSSLNAISSAVIPPGLTSLYSMNKGSDVVALVGAKVQQGMKYLPVNIYDGPANTPYEFKNPPGVNGSVPTDSLQLTQLPLSLLLTDFDLDGLPDIVVWPKGEMSLKWLPCLAARSVGGSGPFCAAFASAEAVPIPPLDRAGGGLALGDINKDQSADLVIASPPEPAGGDANILHVAFGQPL